MKKTDVAIGDKFGTWTVIKASSDDNKKYNYNYLCRCDCGAEKEFSKYNLLRGKQAVCKKCLETTSDKEKYNQFLKMISNKGIVSETENIDANVEYLLKCDVGHGFKSSLKKFNGCPVCKRQHTREQRNVKLANEGVNFVNTYLYESKHWDYEKNTLKPQDVLPNSNQEFWFNCECGKSFSVSPANIKHGIWCPDCRENRSESRLAEYTKELCKSVFKGTITEMPINVTLNDRETTLYADIIIEELKLNIEIHGKHHYIFNPHFHQTKKDFFDSVNRDIAKKKWMEYNGFKQVVIDVTDNFDNDVRKTNGVIKSLLGL